MTHLVGIRLLNYGRFRGEHEIGLGPGVWAIEARDQQDPERSNYLGKSLFVSAIRYALEGCKTRREAAVLDDLISHGHDELSVELEFSDGLFVSRVKKRNRSADLFVSVEGRESRGEKAQLVIDGWLGITPDDRITTCWAEQRELHQIVRLTSTELTETVERWLGSENLVQAGELVDGWLSSVVAQLDEAKSKLVQWEQDADPELVKDLEESIAVERERVQTLQQKQNEYAQKLEEWNERNTLQELKKRRDQHAQSLFEPRRPLWIDRREFSATEGLASDAHKASEALTIASRNKHALETLVTDGFDGKCPLVGISCPAKQEINQRVEANQLALKEATRVAEEAQRTSDKAWGEFRKKEQELKDWEIAKARYEEGKRLLKEMDAELKGKELMDPGEKPEPPEPLDQSQLKEMERELQRRRTAQKEIESIRQTVQELERSYQAHRAAASVLGPEGARKKAVERTVTNIWRDASNRLQQAGSDIRLTPEWGRETGKPAETCRECGAAFPPSAKVKQCLRCGAVRGTKVRHQFRTTLSDYSGAAEDLAGFGLRCAAFDWLRVQRGFCWSIGMFDEPTAQCDQHHRKSVSRHILSLLGRTFEQVFLISHDSGIFSHIPQRIQIVGSGKWSTVTAVQSLRNL